MPQEQKQKRREEDKSKQDDKSKKDESFDDEIFDDLDRVIEESEKHRQKGRRGGQ